MCCIYMYALNYDHKWLRMLMFRVSKVNNKYSTKLICTCMHALLKFNAWTYIFAIFLFLSLSFFLPLFLLLSRLRVAHICNIHISCTYKFWTKDVVLGIYTALSSRDNLCNLYANSDHYKTSECICMHADIHTTHVHALIVFKRFYCVWCTCTCIHAHGKSNLSCHIKI